jgi:hypothetical protein
MTTAHGDADTLDSAATRLSARRRAGRLVGTVALLLDSALLAWSAIVPLESIFRITVGVLAAVSVPLSLLVTRRPAPIPLTLSVAWGVSHATLVWLPILFNGNQPPVIFPVAATVAVAGAVAAISMKRCRPL